MQVTVGLSALALGLALIWGLAVLGGTRSGLGSVRLATAGYIQAVRNTPVLVQMYFLYFGSGMAGYPLSGFTAGLLALVLQNGAYLAEIYRSGIESISKRQVEAGLALGMLRRQAFFIVVLPQAIRRVIAPISNQGVALIKDTALVSTISVAEMTYQGRLIADRTAAVYEVFLTLALLYLLLVSVFTGAMRLLESRVRVGA
jgi:polar amino acid transport system permease protein